MLVYVRWKLACFKGFKGSKRVVNKVAAIGDRGVNMKLVLNDVSQWGFMRWRIARIRTGRRV